MGERPLAPQEDLGSRRRRGLAGLTDPRGRRMGGLAFMLNRLTGLGVLLYLYLHLFVLSTLIRGPDSWNAFVDFATNPLVLTLDVILLAGLLIHGLNGIRVTLTGFGLVLSSQRALFVALMILAAVVLVIGTLRIYEVA